MRKLSTGILLVIVIAFSSCKAKKELVVAKERIAKLESDSASCNTNLTNATAKIGDLNGQLTKCTNQNAELSKDAMAYRELKEDLRARQARLNAALAEQGTSLREIREKIIAGLSQLADSGIDVTIQKWFTLCDPSGSFIVSTGECHAQCKSQKCIVTTGFRSE